tara:strand:+ start:184 stop:1104 length:921 start_codon:yes stop_codon:yes gene_type:complete
MAIVINISQLIIDSILTGSILALGAIGLTLVYRVMNFPNFAHAEFVTFGAYSAYIINRTLELNLVIGSIFSFIGGGLLAIVSYKLVFSKLQTVGTASGTARMTSMLIASIGLSFVFRHTIQEIWGANVVYYKINAPKIYEMVGARFTSIDLVIIGSSVALVLMLHLFLTQTNIGKAIRATADNPNLSKISGIDTEKVIYIVWFISGGVAGFSGLLRGVDTRLTPWLGWNILLIAFTVVILGGIGSFYGAILAAYIIGFAENIGVVALINLGLSTSYRPAIAFTILIIMLILKPRGLFSTSSTRKGG